MKKHWKDLVVTAAPLIAFLERDSYFDQRFSGGLSNKLILTDAEVTHKCAVDESSDEFDEWQAVSDSERLFPHDFEWNPWIDYNLIKNGFFRLSEKNFNGADVKWAQGEGCLLHELMCRDMKILLNCYSNGYFPSIWRQILEVYLNNGFPCGWQGRYPNGKLVVFSNF